MTLTQQITAIDAAVNKSITRGCIPPTVKCAHHGRVKPLYSQQEKRFMLFDGELKKVTIESSVYDFQSLHLLDSGRPAMNTQYGAFEDNTHVLSLIYLGVSRIEYDFVKVLKCLEKTPNLGIVSYVVNSEQVIRDDWRTPVGDACNYDPNLFAFRINYTLQINHLDELL